MKSKSPYALLTTILATPVFAAPFLAIGDNAELFLTGSTSVRFEDNIAFDSANEKSDEIFEFTPGAEIKFGKSSLTKGSFTIFERFIAYSDHTKYNDELFNALFKSLYEGSKLNFSTNASYRELNQTTRDVRAVIASTELAAGANAELSVTEKSKVGLGIQYTDQNYAPAALADNTTFTVPVNYYFAIRPKIDLSAGVRYRNTDSTAAFSDSEDFYLNAGARGAFTPKLSGNFNVGYTARDADTSPGIDGNDGLFGFNAGLAYAYSPKTQFTLDASNDFDTSATGAGQEKTSIALGASSAISTSLTLSTSVTYQNIDNLNGGRSDDYFIFGAGAVYVINSSVNFAAQYSHYTNNSSLAAADFSANVLSFSANFRY